MSNDLIDSNIHFKEALDLSEPTLYHKAVVKFSKALQESPKDRHIIYNDWGNALSNQFKYKAALSKYKISVKISPSFTFAHNGWGTALLNLGHFDGATRRFQKAHELEPNGFLFTANWSLGLYLSGNEAKAVEILQEGMKSIDPNSIWNPINLKIVFQNQIEILESSFKSLQPNNCPKAVVCFSRAAFQKPQETLHILYLDWANALSSQSKYKASLFKYKISTQISPTFPYTYNYWGFALLNLGDFDEAGKKFQKLMVWIQMGLSLILTGA